MTSTISTDFSLAPSSSTRELPYDSFLLVSFGGPEGPDDVIPFLENVLRGKNVPRERMLEVAEHYQHFGGVSPINSQNRELLAAIEEHFADRGIALPIYWGNRNWKPYLVETLEQMRQEGRKRSLAFFTNMFSCYSGCRQYRENIAAAREQVGEGAPLVEKVRFGFNHPGFIDAMRDRVSQAIAALPDSPQGTKRLPIIYFTAHSIPMSMADQCDYVKQLQESCRLIAESQPIATYKLVYQSRSGPPQQPWLEPDICDTLTEDHQSGELTSAVIVPVGFVSDHMEVMYDLDEEAANVCRDLQIPMQRAGTPGVHPRFVEMIGDLVSERLNPLLPRASCGVLGPWHDICPGNCCLYQPPTRPPANRPQS